LGAPALSPAPQPGAAERRAQGTVGCFQNSKRENIKKLVLCFFFSVFFVFFFFVFLFCFFSFLSPERGSARGCPSPVRAEMPKLRNLSHRILGGPPVRALCPHPFSWFWGQEILARRRKNLGPVFDPAGGGTRQNHTHRASRVSARARASSAGDMPKAKPPLSPTARAERRGKRHGDGEAHRLEQHGHQGRRCHGVALGARPCAACVLHGRHVTAAGHLYFA